MSLHRGSSGGASRVPAPGVFVLPPAGGFPVEGETLAWGTTAAELKSHLLARKLLREPADDEMPGGVCREVCGFAAISFQAEPAPKGLPVRVLTYHLAPYDPNLAVADPRYWVMPISAALGEPEEPYAVGADERAQAGEGTVIYHGSWQAADIQISLSIFGGQRPEQAGMAAGYLYLSWTDTAAAAAPHLPGFQARQDLLDKIAAGCVLEVISVDYEMAPRFPEQDPVERQRQRALLGDPIFETPSNWSAVLKKHQLACWVSPDGRHWGLANRWDTVMLDSGSTGIRMSWENLLPGRFGGHMAFSLNGFHVMDHPNSAAVTRLAQFASNQTGCELVCSESVDNG